MTSDQAKPTAKLRRVVVGTAGHVDHGKTSLVEALTGTDCDRWAEEKERGITIDLGFAYYQAELGKGEVLQLGFVDVPGHERFVDNALAGLGGIGLMMMVVAADEGIKPQTREHLDICSLLKIPAGLVVITKSDLVDQEILELAQLELQEALACGPFDGVPMISVSSKTGDGIDALRDQLITLASAIPKDRRSQQRPARLPVDRAFHLQGLGVVCTGTQQAGTLTVGDTLSLFPQTGSARIRSLQVHGEERQSTTTGERVSTQLTGVQLDQVPRGTVLGPPDSLSRSRILLVRYRHLDRHHQAASSSELKPSSEVRFHQFTGDQLARIRPLDRRVLAPSEEGICVLYLRRAVSVARGDRFILRRPSPAGTLGGGEILDPCWRKPRGRNLSQHLKNLAGTTEDAVLEWTTVAREAGVSEQALCRRLAVLSKELAPLLDRMNKEGKTLETGVDKNALTSFSRKRLLISPLKVKEVGDRAQQQLRVFFKQNRLAAGMPKAALITGILPPEARQLGPEYLQWLSALKLLVVQGDSVNLPGRSTGINDQESDLATAIVEIYEKEGLTPRSPPELQRSLGAPPKVFDGILRYLTQQKSIVRLPSGLFLSQAALENLKATVLAEPWDEITVGDFKNRFSLSRKWAIPLLEYLDTQRVTRRQGSVRLVLRR